MFLIIEVGEAEISVVPESLMREFARGKAHVIFRTFLPTGGKFAANPLDFRISIVDKYPPEEN